MYQYDCKDRNFIFFYRQMHSYQDISRFEFCRIFLYFDRCVCYFDEGGLHVSFWPSVLQWHYYLASHALFFLERAIFNYVGHVCWSFWMEMDMYHYDPVDRDFTPL